MNWNSISKFNNQHEQDFEVLNGRIIQRNPKTHQKLAANVTA